MTGARTRVAEPPARPPELMDQFSSWLIGGRWLFVIAETVETVLHLVFAPWDTFLTATLAVVFAYNAFTLWMVHRFPWRRLPLGMMLGGDLFFILLVALQTGGVGSPFLGQCHLVIFTAALAYGLFGGLTVGFVSAFIAVFTALNSPEFLSDYVRDRFPYFIATGAFAGYMADRLQRTLVERWQAERSAHQQALEAAGGRREMELAREVQLSALPTEPPDFPGWEVEPRIEYSQMVGGDFYLYVTRGQVPAERPGLAVGDVCGKGMAAALSATSIAYLLPAFGPLESPPRALARLNEHLGRRLPEDSFVTLALVFLAPSGEVEVWTAGHPPPIVWRAEARRVEETTPRGPLLGVMPDWEGHPFRTRLDPGDALVLYTDGLTELRDSAGFQFDEGGIASALHTCGNGTAAEIADEVFSRARAWGEVDDDLTLVVCRYVGQDSSPSSRDPSAESSAGG